MMRSGMGGFDAKAWKPAYFVWWVGVFCLDKGFSFL